MFTFKPIDAVFGEVGDAEWHSPARWLLAYQQFARACKAGEFPHEILNRTSSINNSAFAPFADEPGDRARGRLAALFTHVGQADEAGRFLKTLGIRKPEDLAKPVAVHGWQPQKFPGRHWFMQEGRRFKKPGPNSCHPRAVWVMRTELKLDWQLRWEVALVYGYRHDGSWWHEAITQHYRESLDDYAGRVDAWLEERLEPEEENARRARPYHERKWGDRHLAVRELFWGDFGADMVDFDKKLTDLLCTIPGWSLTEGRILLTPERLKILQGWARQTRNVQRSKMKPR